MKLPIALNRVLIAMFDSASVLLMIAKRAGPKSAVKEIGLYSMINVVCQCVSSSSSSSPSPSLYLILYHLPLSEIILPG